MNNINQKIRQFTEDRYKMKLKDLIQVTNYKKIFNEVYKHYMLSKEYSKERISDMDLAFHRAYEELKKTEGQVHEDEEVAGSVIFITRSKTAVDDEDYIDVCLKNSKNGEIYSIDFIEWEYLVGLEIENDFDLNKHITMAHILWELTFWGFSSSAVKIAAEDLKVLSDEAFESLEEFE